MAARFLAEVLTPQALAAQRMSYGRSFQIDATDQPDALGPDEMEHVRARDSFYIATVTSHGWPYVQHRGGPPGFLHVLDAHTLAFADLKGNRQLVTTGNLSTGDRAALILVDYPRRERLKLLCRVEVLDATQHSDLTTLLAPSSSVRARVERLMRLHVVGLDWNCAAYITPRYTEGEIASATMPLRERIAELEAKLRELERDG